MGLMRVCNILRGAYRALVIFAFIGMLACGIAAGLAFWWVVTHVRLVTQ